MQRLWGLRWLRRLRRLRVIVGTGLGWRPETAWLIDQRQSLAFTEVIAESICTTHVPAAIRQLRERMPIVPHGIGLSLGSAEGLSVPHLEHLARVAEVLDAPLVSEHVSFCRSGGVDIGHLTAIPRTHEMLERLIANVGQAQRVLGVPLALENIATLFEWPDAEIDEPELLRTLVDETGCQLLLDVANLSANAINHAFDAEHYLDRFPLDAVAYVHVAGGVLRDGLYHDTHAHPVSDPCLALLQSLRHRGCNAGALLERDDRFPPPQVLQEELDALESLRVMEISA